MTINKNKRHSLNTFILLIILLILILIAYSMFSKEFRQRQRDQQQKEIIMDEIYKQYQQLEEQKNKKK